MNRLNKVKSVFGLDYMFKFVLYLTHLFVPSNCSAHVFQTILNVNCLSKPANEITQISKFIAK